MDIFPSVRLMTFSPLLGCALALCVGLSACKTAPTVPSTEEEYMVIQDFTPFFVNGPQQFRGPDQILRTNERVLMTRKEWGFSLVKLENGRTGYVANELLAVAPPKPKPKPIVESFTTTSGGKKKKGAADQSPYVGFQVNDVPLPNLPPPDLNIAPEDAPLVAPSPSASPSVPKFRY